ncbi:hypothetical protein Tco_1078198 [Tanacetum coccineum]
MGSCEEQKDGSGIYVKKKAQDQLENMAHVEEHNLTSPQKFGQLNDGANETGVCHEAHDNASGIKSNQGVKDGMNIQIQKVKANHKNIVLQQESNKEGCEVNIDKLIIQSGERMETIKNLERSEGIIDEMDNINKDNSNLSGDVCEKKRKMSINGTYVIDGKDKSTASSKYVKANSGEKKVKSNLVKAAMRRKRRQSSMKRNSNENNSHGSSDAYKVAHTEVSSGDKSNKVANTVGEGKSRSLTREKIC